MLDHIGRHSRDGPREIGRVGSHDVRLESREVDLDDLVKKSSGILRDLGICTQQLGALIGQVGQLLPPGRLEVRRHALVVGKDRGRRTEFGAHVRNRPLAGAADRRGAGAEVLDHPIGPTLYRQRFADLEDDVLGDDQPESRPVRCTPTRFG